MLCRKTCQRVGQRVGDVDVKTGRDRRCENVEEVEAALGVWLMSSLVLPVLVVTTGRVDEGCKVTFSLLRIWFTS